VPLYWCDYEPLDQSKPWAAVVLRNLPLSATQESLRSLTAAFQIPIKRIEKPRLLQGASLCTLLILDDLEAAEALCLKLHRLETEGHRLKAHVHPDSRLIRPPDSHHSIFNSGVRKRSKKSQDLEALAVSPTTATPGLELLSAGDLDQCAVLAGPCVREFPGESYSLAAGCSKHSGANVVYRALG